jgi:hypothetical protein
MCTVTIFRSDAGFTATMNRDEAYLRAPERRPEIRATVDGTEWAAPFDGEKGGTWMGVNAFGVAACLLNAYQPGESLLPDTTGRRPTRGEIVPVVLAAGEGESARRWVEEAFDPAKYPSFTLLLVTPEESLCYEWRGSGLLQTSTPPSPWAVRSSSGWDSMNVIQWREERFARWLESGAPHTGALPSFHLLQEPGFAGHSPLMRREWSATRSITQARVLAAPGRAELLYWSAPTPETRDPEAHCSMRLAGAPVSARAG